MTHYNIGDWIRAYTTSLRGPGSTTEIGEVVQFTEIKHSYSGRVECRGILIKNAQYSAVVRESDVIEKIDPVALWQENWPGEPLPAYIVEWQKRTGQVAE